MSWANNQNATLQSYANVRCAWNNRDYHGLVDMVHEKSAKTRTVATKVRISDSVSSVVLAAKTTLWLKIPLRNTATDSKFSFRVQWDFPALVDRTARPIMIGWDQTVGVGTCLDSNSTSPKIQNPRPAIVGAYGFAFFFLPFPLPTPCSQPAKIDSLVRMRTDMHDPTKASND